MKETPTNPALRVAVGAVSGAACALVRSPAMRASRRLPLRLQPTLPRRDPDAFLVAKLERLLRRPLPWRLHAALARALRVGYGSATGALVALVTRRRGIGTVG